jgi:hypothetical protein
MGKILTLPEQRVVLEDVSWGTYEHLLTQLRNWVHEIQ